MDQRKRYSDIIKEQVIINLTHIQVELVGTCSLTAYILPIMLCCSDINFFSHVSQRKAKHGLINMLPKI
jgi:hypothetical protein